MTDDFTTDAQNWREGNQSNTPPVQVAGGIRSDERVHALMDVGAARVIIGTAAVKYGGSPSGVHYVAAKGALDAMTVAFAKAGAACGIRVNGVRCGVVNSGMHLNVPGYTDARFAKPLDESLIRSLAPEHQRLE